MQAALVRCLELGATDCAVFLVDLSGNVLVLVATILTAIDTAKFGQRCTAVFALSSAGRFQTYVRLVPLKSFVAAPTAIHVICTALRKEFRTLWALNLRRCK